MERLNVRAVARRLRCSRAAALSLVAAIASVSLNAPASAAVIKTNEGLGADAEFREAATGNGSGRGNAGDMNARWQDTGTSANNELFAVRFDISGIALADRANIQNASLSLISTRANNANSGVNGLIVTGLNDSVANQNWTEGSTNFATMPGLVNDNNLNTRSFAAGATTSLGTVSWDHSTTSGGTGALPAGQVVTFSGAALDSFLQGFTGNLVTFFFQNQISTTGQIRFTSKETSALGSTANPDSGTGQFAPSLSYDIAIPEPTGLIGLALGGLALLRRQRVGA